jgi:pimeloyl-ACP methyl ester carboxylesterase
MEASSAIARQAIPSTRDVRDRLIATLPVTERRLTLNGVDTAVLEGGAGKPVVLLHGPGGYGAAWIHVIPALAKSHRVIACDLPGHGASGFFDEAPDAENVNGWLDDLIECTCSSQPVLAGHTLGGAIGARFAAEHSRRLAALVLVDSFGLAPFHPSPAFGLALQAFLAGPDERTHDDLWRQCAYDYETVSGRVGDRWTLIKEYNLAGVRQPDRLAALGAWMERVGGPAIPAELLARISTPTTLIWGREDRATPLAVASEAHARYGWPLHVIEGAADDPAIEQPEAFLKILRRLLEE